MGFDDRAEGPPARLVRAAPGYSFELFLAALFSFILFWHVGCQTVGKPVLIRYALISRPRKRISSTVPWRLGSDPRFAAVKGGGREGFDGRFALCKNLGSPNGPLAREHR